MNSEVLASDPITKITTIFHPTTDDAGTFHIEDVQDVTDLVEANKRTYNSMKRGHKYGSMARIASIPLTTFFELWKKGMFRGAKLSKDDKKWLNDRDNEAFRTRPGRV